MLFTVVLRVAVDRFSPNADVVKGMVRTKAKDDKGGVEARGPEKGRHKR